MAKDLEKQVFVYTLDTSSFYNEYEQMIHRKLTRSYLFRDHLKTLDIKSSKYIYDRIKMLKEKLNQSFEDYKEIRTLREDSLKSKNVIAMFESALTRTMKIKSNELNTDFFVVRAYYYKVLESLIKNGFTYANEKYIYFSSSAGQIRNKKCGFIRESLWNKYEKSLTCGLSIDDINAKGGCNVNKLLAYKALTNSASIEWKSFNIDRAIVVDDLETDVTGIVDFINRDTYEITRKEMSVPINHTDGCGLILPKVSKKSFMVRLPWMKGLLTPFDYMAFATENNQTKVTDIYGKEWDIVKDNIQIIFTKSQFKMHKYYTSWDDYKQKFKENKCQAVKLNEEDIGENAVLNYQMIQTLTDIADSELEELCKMTIEDITKIGSDKETMLCILGAKNNRKNHFQEALSIYPELLNDSYAKQVIKDKKKSLIKNALSGKISVNGKYTFIIPDMYAFCQRLFLGVEKPKGLLSNGEVFCRLYDEGKVDVLRSPHLYKEHAIRQNVKDNEKEKWFISQGIYTSTYDLISKMLQFDNDGDKALVCQDALLIKIAERNMKDVVPLYYQMATAKAQIINQENIYNSLSLAYKANIGEVSNNISKILNNSEINFDVIKWLCMEVNFTIDNAKTLYMPTRPTHIDKIISKYTKHKLPHFFIYAKDKDKKMVEEINNSTVNRLVGIIPNKPIKFKKIAGVLDCKLLMDCENTKTDHEIVKKYKYLAKISKFSIRNSQKQHSKYYIFNEIRKSMLEVHSNEKRIVNVLVKHLYIDKPSAFKTTLWWTYGDILLNNLKVNLKNTMQCEMCGKRIDNTTNQKYCKECFVLQRKIYNAEKQKVYRKKKRVQFNSL